jgi:SAM-dependent methyltransferase
VSALTDLHPDAETVRHLSTLANADTYDSPEQVSSYLADDYHAVRRELAAEAFVEAADREPLPEGPVLEIGGNASSLLGSLNLGDRPQICADISAAGLALSKAWDCHRIRLNANRPLPFADGCLAAIVMGELIEHIFDPPSLLRECHRVLRPGGLLVLTTPNLAGPQDRLGFLLGRAPRQIDPLHPYLYLHIRPFTAQLLHRVLTSTGFRQTSLRSNAVGWQLRSGRWIMSRRLARWLPALGGSLIVAART